MLNINKIHSLVNSSDFNMSKVAKGTGINYQSFKSKMKSNSWSPNDIEKIADYFDKPMLYFFDREEEQSVVNEDSPPYGCRHCAEKQKEIDRLNKKIQEVYGKYTDLLEGKNTNARNCG